MRPKSDQWANPPTGHPYARAHRGADHAGQERVAEGVGGPVERIAAIRPAVDEVGPHQSLERVPRRDPEAGGDRAGGGEVDEERSGEDGGPHFVAEGEQGGQRDPGGRPDGGRAGIDERQPEAELAGQEVGAGEQEHYDGTGKRPPAPC